MNTNEIMKWCEDRAGMERRYDYYNGYCDNYMLTFENGETYEFLTVWRNMFDKTVTIKLNGEVASHRHLKWHNFGWQDVAA